MRNGQVYYQVKINGVVDYHVFFIVANAHKMAEKYNGEIVTCVYEEFDTSGGSTEADEEYRRIHWQSLSN